MDGTLKGLEEQQDAKKEEILNIQQHMQVWKGKGINIFVAYSQCKFVKSI